MASAAGPLHIMHVVRHGFAGGGMENGIVNVANGLPSRRFRVSVCALDRRETFSERILSPDSEYHLLPKTGRGVDWKLIWHLARLFRRAKVDVVHSHNWASFLYAVPAAKLAGIPIIHGEHGKNATELNETNRPKRWAKRVLGSRVDRVVTVSQAIAAEWAAYGVPAGRIQAIPNGVDVERFRPRPAGVELRRQYGLPEDGYLFGSVGRFDPVKNYQLLIAAFARLAPQVPNWNLALFGDGECETALRRQAAELGIADRVYWLGRRADPENFLPVLDIFVLPSLSEGMSNVVLEAMSSGLAMVCTDLPGHREVFAAGEEGITVASGNSEALAAGLADLASRADLRLKLGQAARAKILARFSMARMIAAYENLYSRFEQASRYSDLSLMSEERR